MWIPLNNFLDRSIFFVMMANKSLTYAVALSLEVKLNYHTNCMAAQAYQQWRLELMTHEKQSPHPASPGSAGHPQHTEYIPSLWWALHLKIRPRIVNLISFNPSGSSVSGGHSVSLCDIEGLHSHFLLSKRRSPLKATGKCIHLMVSPVISWLKYVRSFLVQVNIKTPYALNALLCSSSGR